MTSGVTTISGSTFDGNSAGSEAGAISGARTLAISDSVVVNNHANEKGGVAREPVPTILGGGFESLVINRCNISNNTSNRTSGGVFLAGGSGSISNSTISGNTAVMRGGGVFSSGAALTVTNTTIDGNTGDLGGDSFQEGTETKPLILNNVTITSNRATNHAGGLFQSTGIGALRNTIIALNTSDSGFTGHSNFFNLHFSRYNLTGSKMVAHFIPMQPAIKRAQLQRQSILYSALYKTTVVRLSHGLCWLAALQSTQRIP